MTAVLLAAGAFLVGSFPSGVIIARARGVDLRTVGSGNIGATNVGRALGKGWAVVVLLIDAAKGFVPAAIAGRLLAHQPWGVAAVGLASVLGHCFSIFLRGHGGKGVATSFGVALALAPVAALASFAVYALLYALWRVSSVGSLAAVIAFPLITWALGEREPAIMSVGVAIALVVVIRHKDNIRRLVRDEELKA